jgi:hypothetical protein
MSASHLLLFCDFAGNVASTRNPNGLELLRLNKTMQDCSSRGFRSCNLHAAGGRVVAAGTAIRRRRDQPAESGQ